MRLLGHLSLLLPKSLKPHKKFDREPNHDRYNDRISHNGWYKLINQTADSGSKQYIRYDDKYYIIINE